MGSYRIVLVLPRACDDARFGQGREAPSIQTRCPKDAVEALVVWVLPRAPGIDEMRADDALLEPSSNRRRDKRAVVVAADASWSSPQLHQRFKNAQDIGRRETPAARQAQVQARELVDDRQKLERPTSSVPSNTKS